MMGTTSSGTLIVLFGMYVSYVRTTAMSSGVCAQRAWVCAGLLSVWRAWRRRARAASWQLWRLAPTRTPAHRQRSERCHLLGATTCGVTADRGLRVLPTTTRRPTSRREQHRRSVATPHPSDTRRPNGRTPCASGADRRRPTAQPRQSPTRGLLNPEIAQAHLEILRISANRRCAASPAATDRCAVSPAVRQESGPPWLQLWP